MDILTLIRSYVEGLLDAEDRFIGQLDSFPELEETVVRLTNQMAAGRTADNVGDINIVLFSTLKHMFSPTANYIKQKGLLRGLRALKWISYPAWESIALNFLMLVPLGYLTPYNVK